MKTYMYMCIHAYNMYMYMHVHTASTRFIVTFIIFKVSAEWREDLNLVPPQPVGVSPESVPRKLGRRVAIVRLTIYPIVSLCDRLVGASGFNLSSGRGRGGGREGGGETVKRGRRRGREGDRGREGEGKKGEWRIEEGRREEEEEGRMRSREFESHKLTSLSVPYPHSLAKSVLHIIPVLVIVFKLISRLVRLLLLLAGGQGLGCGHGPRENRDPLQCSLDRLLKFLQQCPLEPVEHEKQLGEEVKEGVKDFELLRSLFLVGRRVLVAIGYRGRGALVVLDERVDVEILLQQVVDETTRNLLHAHTHTRTHTHTHTHARTHNYCLYTKLANSVHNQILMVYTVHTCVDVQYASKKTYRFRSIERAFFKNERKTNGYQTVSKRISQGAKTGAARFCSFFYLSFRFFTYACIHSVALARRRHYWSRASAEIVMSYRVALRESQQLQRKSKLGISRH